VRDARLTARLPGTDQRGPGWNNLYAREGNAGRNLPPAQLRTFRPASVTTSGARENIFAGSDGNVFRRSDAGWQMNRGTGSWSAVDRVPDAYPSYRSAPSETHLGGFGRPEAGLDQHFAARSEGAARSATIHSFSGGGFHGGGGFRGGGRR
jgi:hypothetical protein